MTRTKLQEDWQEVEKLLTAQQVADVLGVPIRTLYSWRHVGNGPPAIRVGKYLRYRPADLEAWLDRRQAAAS